MTGDPKLSYFKLQLDGVPPFLRKGLVKEFLLTFIASAGLFGLCVAVIWWLAS
ncbi:MAG: hypothetical protein GYA36_19230 [Veillonellaceae bacterium]|nr:hypothetical protein [Veillonellaceae bacterium]